MKIHRDSVWGFLTPINPALGAIYYGILTLRGKRIVAGLREDRTTFGALLGLVIVGLVSALLSPDLAQGLLNLLVLPLFILIYALGRWGIEKPRAFLQAAALGAGFLGLICIVGKLTAANVYWQGIPVLARFTARGNVLGMGDNGLAAMLEVGVTGGLGFFLLGVRRRWLYLGAAFSALMGIFITMSRGSMVGTACAVVVLLAMNSAFVRRHWKVIAVFVLIVLVVVASWSGLTNRVKSIFDLETNKSNIQRIKIWTSSLLMVKDHPLFGVGPGQFSEHFPEYRLPDGVPTHSPHSLYLFVLTQWGILGFLLFFGWFALRTVVPAFTRPDAYRRLAFVMVLSFFVHVVFNDLFVAHVPLIMGLIAREID